MRNFTQSVCSLAFVWLTHQRAWWGRGNYFPEKKEKNRKIFWGLCLTFWEVFELLRKPRASFQIHRIHPEAPSHQPPSGTPPTPSVLHGTKLAIERVPTPDSPALFAPGGTIKVDEGEIKDHHQAFTHLGWLSLSRATK